MTMLFPSINVRRCPIRRAITPAGPAGAKPTTTLIGRLANVCADAMPLAAQATATMAQRNVGLASMGVALDFALARASKDRNRSCVALMLRDGRFAASSALSDRTASRLRIHHAGPYPPAAGTS